MNCCPWVSRLSIPALGLALALTAIVFWEKENTLAQAPSQRLLRHVVLFKFKDATSPEQVQKLVDEFASLAKKITEVHAFEYGTDNSPEKLADGFTHCFLVTFRDEKGRDVYLPHAAHQEFVGHLKPHLDKVLVVDYWTGK